MGNNLPWRDVSLAMIQHHLVTVKSHAKAASKQACALRWADDSSALLLQQSSGDGFHGREAACQFSYSCMVLGIYLKIDLGLEGGLSLATA